MAPGALGEYPRRQLVLRLERPYLAAVLIQEACGGRAKRIGDALRHLGVGEVGRLPKLGFGGCHVYLQVRTQPAADRVAEQTANVWRAYAYG